MSNYPAPTAGELAAQPLDIEAYKKSDRERGTINQRGSAYFTMAGMAFGIVGVATFIVGAAPVIVGTAPMVMSGFLLAGYLAAHQGDRMAQDRDPTKGEGDLYGKHTGESLEGSGIGFAQWAHDLDQKANAKGNDGKYLTSGIERNFLLGMSALAAWMTNDRAMEATAPEDTRGSLYEENRQLRVKHAQALLDKEGYDVMPRKSKINPNYAQNIEVDMMTSDEPAPAKPKGP